MILPTVNLSGETRQEGCHVSFRETHGLWQDGCLPATPLRSRSSLQNSGRNGTPEKRNQRCKNFEPGNEDILAVFEGFGTC